MGTQIEVTFYADSLFDAEEFRVALNKVAENTRDVTLEDYQVFSDDAE